MKITIRKILILFIAPLFLTPFSYSFAQTDYSVLAPLPNTTIGNCGTAAKDPACQTTLAKYIPAIYLLAVGIAVAMAFVVITFGGITYATSDALSGKQDGRRLITNALSGLILVIGSYVIINTINPQMLQFTLDIKDVVGQNQTAPVTAVGCANCVSLGKLPLKAGANDQISPSVLPFLQRLDSNMQAVSGPNAWQITEAFSFGGMHTSTSCHHTGSCVDANPIDPTRRGLVQFYNASRQAGISNITYEVQTAAEKDKLINGCAKCNPPVAGLGSSATWVRVNTQATAPHFHLVP